MTITIEKNVPLPNRRGKIGFYPFGSMEVGDSFTVPLAGEEYASGKGDKALKVVSASASRYARIHGVTFTVRTLKDEGVVRVWRVA